MTDGMLLGMSLARLRDAVAELERLAASTPAHDEDALERIRLAFRRLRDAGERGMRTLASDVPPSPELVALEMRRDREYAELVADWAAAADPGPTAA